MTRKIAFFEGWSWFKVNNLGLALGKNLKFDISLSKGLKIKGQKVLGANFYTCTSYRGKTGRGGAGFLASPILNKVNKVIDNAKKIPAPDQKDSSRNDTIHHLMLPYQACKSSILLISVKRHVSINKQS